MLYGLTDGTHTWNETGTSGTYTVGGWRGSIQTVTLTGLTPNTRYYYQVGDVTVGRYEDTPNLSMPPDLTFVTPPSDSVPIEAAVRCRRMGGLLDWVDCWVGWIGMGLLPADDTNTEREPLIGWLFVLTGPNIL